MKHIMFPSPQEIGRFRPSKKLLLRNGPFHTPAHYVLTTPPHTISIRTIISPSDLANAHQYPALFLPAMMWLGHLFKLPAIIWLPLGLPFFASSCLHSLRKDPRSGLSLLVACCHTTRKSLRACDLISISCPVIKI